MRIKMFKRDTRIDQEENSRISHATWRWRVFPEPEISAFYAGATSEEKVGIGDWSRKDG